jgi:hypothetical protein
MPAFGVADAAEALGVREVFKDASWAAYRRELPVFGSSVHEISSRSEKPQDVGAESKNTTLHTPLPLYGDHENKAVKNLIMKTKNFKVAGA